MINRIEVEGNLCGKERPELKTWQSGDCYLRMSIVWEGEILGRKSKSFFNVVLRGKLAEDFNASDMWARGRRVIVSGVLNAWKSKTNSYYTDIICLKLQFPGSSASAHPAPAGSTTAPKVPAKAPQAPTTVAPANNGSREDEDSLVGE